MRRKPHRRPVAALLALAAASALGACADLQRASGLQTQGLNVESPAAAAAAQVEAEPLVAPTFRDVPPRPPAPKPQVFAQAVGGLHGERGDLNAWTDANPPMIGDTESYATTARGAVGTTAADAPQQDVTPALEDWARRARDAAKPPPAPSLPPQTP